MGKHKGFTFVEISLFLVVTALIFIGIAGGMQNTIFQQKYNDSVQNFLEFLRDIYSEVSNPQSTGYGNSDQAIYGKLVVFGETTDLTGERIDDDEHPVFVYDVVGKVGSIDENTSDKDLIGLLKDLQANVAVKKGEKRELASPEKYSPRWNAKIDDIEGDLFEKTILVVRHPLSGTINTLVYESPIQVNDIFNRNKDACNNSSGSEAANACSAVDGILKEKFDEKENEFRPQEMDFCVNLDGLNKSLFSSPQDIRITKNARNASSVLKIDMDGEENKCK